MLELPMKLSPAEIKSNKPKSKNFNAAVCIYLEFFMDTVLLHLGYSSKVIKDPIG